MYLRIIFPLDKKEDSPSRCGNCCQSLRNISSENWRNVWNSTDIHLPHSKGESQLTVYTRKEGWIYNGLNTQIFNILRNSFQLILSVPPIEPVIPLHFSRVEETNQFSASSHDWDKVTTRRQTCPEVLLFSTQLLSASWLTQFFSSQQLSLQLHLPSSRDQCKFKPR